MGGNVRQRVHTGAASTEQFACLHGHRVTVWLENGMAADLSGYVCPICLGRVKDHAERVDSFVLAPVQVRVDY